MPASSSGNLAALEESSGYSFRNKSLLTEAVTHKSYAHEQQGEAISCNERMEFLGDAVLELIVSEYLYRSYSHYTEAELSRIKSYTVQESTLAEAARHLDMGSHLHLGKGEDLSGGRNKPSLLADAFEALLAAVYLDSGYRNARDFALRHLRDIIDDVAASDFIFDYKTKLQELAQSKYGVLPRYVTHREEGPEHQKMFEVKVYIMNDYYGTGRGKTKKAAAQKAAEAGLRKAGRNR